MKTNKLKTAVKAVAKVTKGSSDVVRKIKVGDYTKIARATGYDYSHVWRVINGESSNPSGEIMKYTATVIKNRK